jgi:hypothetical protein
MAEANAAEAQKKSHETMSTTDSQVKGEKSQAVLSKDHESS